MSAFTGVAKSYAVAASVLPPSALSNQPANVAPSLAGSIAGFVAVAPAFTVCAAGTGVPPIASKLTVNWDFAGTEPRESNFHWLLETMLFANAAAAVSS